MKEVKKEAELLEAEYAELDNFKGAKQRAQDIHGITGDYFRRLLREGLMGVGSVDKISQLRQAVKQSAFESFESAKKINVLLGNEVG